MRLLVILSSLSAAISVLGLDDPAPAPKISNIEYWGSACPEEGLSAVIGPVDATTNSASLTFTLANYLPVLGGTFGSSLRMCNLVSQLTIDKGWKVMVNARGTNARGNAELKGNATMFLRSTYSFSESMEHQSIGMLDVPGPLNGPFSKKLTPEEGDKGVVGPCGGGELVIEFQARAVQDLASRMRRRLAANEKSWTLTTDMDIQKC